MAEIFEILEEVIAKEFKIEQKSGGLRICEENENATGKEVVLKTSGKTFGFTLDHNENTNFRVFRFFNSSTANINSKNDAIIFCKNNEKIYCLLVELKSKTSRTYLKQIKAGKIFAEFLISTINLYYDTDYKPSYRGILFRDRKTVTKGTSKRQRVNYDKKDDIMIATEAINRPYFISYFFGE